jgi:anti-anti-sigma factor
VLFDVRVLPVGDWDVLCVVGDVDLATVPALRQSLDRLEAPSAAIDLSGVDYLDPVALGVLLVGSLRAARSGGRFAVVCPAGPARDLLVETGVERILTVVDDQRSLPPPAPPPPSRPSRPPVS